MLSLPGFCFPSGLFCRFGGVFRCLSQLSIDESQGWTLKDLDREAVYSPKFESAARFFPSTQRRIVHWSPFPVGLENLQTFCSNSNDFCFTTGAFNFPTQLATFQHTTTQLEINISDCSCVTNATYQTGAQSKISINIQPLSPDCAPVW